jgi:hypothetical protein
MRLAGLMLGVLLACRAPAQTNVVVVTNVSMQALTAALATGGYVQFTNDFSLAVSSNIQIGNTVTLDGAGHKVTLSGGNSLRIFTILPGANVGLQNMTFSGGRSLKGGALYVSSGSQVTITNCIFSGNTASGLNGDDGGDGLDSASGSGSDATAATSGTDGIGGAIFNYGSLTNLNCSFLSNSVTGGQGGNGGNGGNGAPGRIGGLGTSGQGGGNAYGACIYNAGTLSAYACTFSGNSAVAGSGGVAGTNGQSATGLEVSSGGSGGAAGGVGIYSTTMVVVASCTFSSNTATAGNSETAGILPTGNGKAGPNGGVASGGGIVAQGAAFVTNCTFFGNNVTGGAGGDGGAGTVNSGSGGNGGDGAGGGIYSAGSVFVVNCTFAGCGAIGGTNGAAGSSGVGGTDGAPGFSAGGGVGKGPGKVTIQNTLFSANGPGDNVGLRSGVSASSVIDAGLNLVVSNLGVLKNSIKATNAFLGPLANNGGPTMTMALLSNSPAIDRIPPNQAPPVDQRGAKRPQGPRSDIGAFEFVAAPVIVMQPQNQTNAFGSNVTFSVSVFGDSPQYQWYYNTNIELITNLSSNLSEFITNSFVVTNGTGATLSFSGASISNAGNYFVVVTNAFGATNSDPALLFVGPHISVPLTNWEVPFLTNAYGRFEVVFQGSPPLFHQWYFNQTNPFVATGDEQVTSNALSVDITLTIPSPTLFDQGTYSIVVTNYAGIVTSTPPAQLIVDLPPLIVSQPSNQNALIGAPASFTVGVLSPPNPPSPLHFLWLFNQTNALVASSSPTFTINSVQTNNAGNYSVLATNNFGGTLSTNVSLTVGSLGTNGSVPLAANYSAVGVFVSGNYAYLALSNTAGSGGALQVVNASNALAPQTFTNSPLPLAGARGVFVAADFAYVAGGSAGLLVVDVSLPQNPALVSTVTDNLSAANGVFVTNSIVYVADGNSGLNLFDITDPLNPVFLASTNVGGVPVNVTVAGNYAYVAASTGGLQAVNISNPTNLVRGGSYGNISGSVVAVKVPGRYAYVAESSAGLAVIDVSTTNFNQVGSYSNVLAEGLDVSSNFVFIAGGNQGLVAVKASVTNSTNVAFAFAGNNTVADARTVDVSGRYAYVAAGAEGLKIFDAGMAFDTPPQILAQPMSLTVKHGSNAFFSVTVNGSTPLGYLWQQNGIPLTNTVATGDTNITGITSPTLEIMAARVSDDGAYSVIVSNAQGIVTSAAAQLTVTGCVFTLTPPSTTNTGGAFSGQFDVTTTTNECDWMASTTNTWIHLANGSTTNGNNTVFYMADANPSTNARSGFIFIGATNFFIGATNSTFEIDQGGSTTTNIVFGRGTYNGLFSETNVLQRSAGFFKITVSGATTNQLTNGLGPKFSGTLQLGGARYPLNGQFDSSGFFTKTVVRKNASLQVNLQIDAVDPDQISGFVSGDLSDIPWIAPLEGFRGTFNAKTNPAPQQRYTLIIPGDVSSTNSPGGDSWQTINVSKAGAVNMSGALADGPHVSQNAVLSKFGAWPLYLTPYSGKGLVTGWITNDPATGVSGQVTWIKPAMKTKVYQGGFTNDMVNVIGSTYTKPPKGAPVLNFTDADIILAGGGLDQPQTNRVTLGADNKVTSTDKSKLNINLSTGAFTGSVISQLNNKPVQFGGVVLTNLNSGQGFFLNGSQSGEVTFQAH